MKKRPKKKIKKIKKIRPKKAALHSETKKSIVVVVCFTLALLSLLSYFEAAGVFGQYFLQIGRLFFGQGFFLIPLGLILAGLAILIPRFSPKNLVHRSVYRPVFIGIILFIFSVLGFFYIFGHPAAEVALEVSVADSNRTGGYLGLLIGYPLIRFLGFWASLVVLFALLLVSILVTFNLPLRRKEEKEEKEIAQPTQSFDVAQTREAKEEVPLPEKEKKPGLLERWKERAKSKTKDRKIIEERIEDQGIKEEDQRLKTEDRRLKIDGQKMPVFKVQSSDFKLPPLDLLEKDKGQPTSGDIKANLNIIKRTLQNFGIEVEMAEVNIGPTVTQYTLRPAHGVKLSRITALQNDLALALAAHPLRIEAPIPGRPLVGIEIPNRSTVLVRLRNLLESTAWKELPSNLSFALGRSVAGRPIFADLTRMPHLLIAGATGTGKTIGINSLIISLLYQNSPATLKLILIDPKRVEFTPYDGIPHLLSPVIVQSDKAVNALRWAINEMDRRFGVLQEAGARDIVAYNSQADEIMPYLVIVIDELADLMAARGREVEAAIVRLAQMARAVGIHLVVSTQRPSVEVITGLIKANITSRIAFQVASQVDSRTILDMAGAEKLLGQGDMLYLAGDTTKPRRIQGTYISDKEIKRVTNYLKKAQEPEYNQAVTMSSDFPWSADRVFKGGEEMDDELYEEAKEVISQAGKASASLLQRRLRIGYARAARLLDMLEERGIIGPADGAKPREVLTGMNEEIE
jgi:S-DNA-T family DNA segregation ATPase FtsK/SpoIIIE